MISHKLNLCEYFSFLSCVGHCVFQDLRERRSVWKHISHSNDTEALRCDAFKKQCYMKVNMAIKSFLKRRPARQQTSALPLQLTLRRDAGARLDFKSKDIDLYIYILFEASKKIKDQFGRVCEQGVTGINPRDSSSYRNESKIRRCARDARCQTFINFHDHIQICNYADEWYLSSPRCRITKALSNTG